MKFFESMKRYILLFACLFFALWSCRKEELPENPYVQFPIKSLVVSMNGNDEVTATPQVNEDKTMSNVMLVKTFKTWVSAEIRALVLAPGVTASIKEGDMVAFKDDRYSFTLTSGGEESEYVLLLDYPKEPEPEPETDPYMWFVVKGVSGGPLADGKIHEDASPKLMRTRAADKTCTTYEAYVDLSGYAWDNIGVARKDQSMGYEYEHDSSLGSSWIDVTMTEQAFDGAILPVGGPWGDWYGVYKINFDYSSKEFSALKTNWAVNGTATGNAVSPMSWDAEKKVFVLETALSAGVFKFVTVPENASDPTVLYGGVGMSGLSTSGESISVASDGEYRITLDLLSSPYSYKVEKIGGEDPGPAGAFMYVCIYADGPSASTPRIFDQDGDGVYEGHVKLAGLGRGDGFPLLLVNESMTNYYSANAQNLATVPENGYAVVTFYEGVYPGYIDSAGAYCPWGAWNKGSGMWMVRYDSASRECFIMQTEWYISGSAAGGADLQMTYSVADGTWSVTGDFSAGDFRFVTQKGKGVTGSSEGEGTPLDEEKQISYGMESNGVLVENGAAISIHEAGKYTIRLDLSNPSGYKYSVLKDGEEPGPGPDADYVMVVFKGGDNFGEADPDISPKLYETSTKGIYRSDVDLTGHAWHNLGIVTSDLSRGFDYEHGAALPDDTFTIVMNEKEVEGGKCNTSGPWGNWDGIYTMTFNLDTRELTVTKK